MAGGQPAFADESLDGRRQLEEAQGVGDRDPAPADPARELVVGEPEVLDQLLVGAGLLERVQVLAVEVLDERLLDGTELVGVTDEGGDRGEPGLLGRPPAALPRDQLVRSVARSVAPAPAGGRRPRAPRRSASTSDSSSKWRTGLVRVRA